MTSTVTTSPDELAYDLIVYMNKLETGKDDESEYLNECKGLIEAAKFGALITKVLESQEKIFSDADSQTGAPVAISIRSSGICSSTLLTLASSWQMRRDASVSLHR